MDDIESFRNYLVDRLGAVGLKQEHKKALVRKAKGAKQGDKDHQAIKSVLISWGQYK